MKTILVLEDEPLVMTLLRHILSSGYEFLPSTTANEALQRFRDHQGKVDLVIADVTLPVSSGIHVALELRSLNPYLKIVLTSGLPPSMWPDQESAELSEIPSDSVDTLLKPFLPAVVRNIVEKLIGPPEQASESKRATRATEAC